MTKYDEILNDLNNKAQLLVVSKNRSITEIEHYYNLGQRDFGENKAQELLTKVEFFKDVKWHFIGHLQRNKVKQIIPYTHLIHSVDNIELIKVIQKEAKKINKIQNILLELKLTDDENKTGLTINELENILLIIHNYPNIKLVGLMAMGPHTEDIEKINKTFGTAYNIFNKYKDEYNLSILSMGMSNDYKIAIKNGSTLVRIGTILF